MLFLCDTYMVVDPTAEQVTEMTLLAAEAVRGFGLTPKAALVSHSSFGASDTESARKMRRALAMILDHHRNQQKNLGELFSQVKNLIETQLASSMAELSGSTRFHMLLCLARMGVTLDPARVRRPLQLGVDDSEASAVAKVFEKKPTKK